MNKVKKSFFVFGITLVLIAACSLSAFAYNQNIDYTCEVSGADAMPPLHLNEYPNTNYQWVVIFTQNDNGYGYRVESCVPRVSGVTFVPLWWSSQSTWSWAAVNSTSSNVNLGPIRTWVYDEDNTVVYSTTYSWGSLPANWSTYPAVGNIICPSSYCSTWANFWFTSSYGSTYVTGGPPPVQNQGVSAVPFTFTLNSSEPSEPSEPGADDGGGDTPQVIDYTELLETIIENQGTQIDKLDTIISLLRGNSNQVVVDAIEDATDEVINTKPNGATVPDMSFSQDDEFPTVEYDDEDLDELGIMSGGSALTWFYARLDDLATSNSKVLGLIVSCLSLGFITLILNKRS